MSDKYYCVFSREQYQLKKEIENKVNRIQQPKEVLVNGTFKPFTEMIKVADGENWSNKALYSDAIIVAIGDKDKLKIRKRQSD